MSENRSSGTYNFRPAFADFIIESFERIQIEPAVLDDPKYLIGARRSANIVLLDLSANRGVNLWTVGDETLNIPLVGGKTEYILPDNVINLFDCYIRTYTPGGLWREVGFSPAFETKHDGTPVLNEHGEPGILEPGSGTFWTEEGSPYITMRWPGHGLMAGAPIFWRTPIVVGGMTIYGFVIVARVLNPDSLTFVAPEPARLTNHACGATPLFVAQTGQRRITVIAPHHHLAIGDVFTIPVPVHVGGIELFGDYSVVTVPDELRFEIPTHPGPHVPVPNEVILGAHSQPQLVTEAGRVLDAAFDLPHVRHTESVYLNNGIISATTQATGVQWTDVIVWPISRNNYAALPNKQAEGRPSVYWFDRTEAPKISFWATPARGHHWGFVAYRMRYMDDADPTANLDLPRRIWPAFIAQLTANLAEKYNPQAYPTKLQLAEAAWNRAADADREFVGSFIVPTLQPYFRNGNY